MCRYLRLWRCGCGGGRSVLGTGGSANQPCKNDKSDQCESNDKCLKYRRTGKANHRIGHWLVLVGHKLAIRFLLHEGVGEHRHAIRSKRIAGHIARFDPRSESIVVCRHLTTVPPTATAVGGSAYPVICAVRSHPILGSMWPQDGTTEPKHTAGSDTNLTQTACHTM
jgi:hypothetical protein